MVNDFIEARIIARQILKQKFPKKKFLLEKTYSENGYWVITGKVKKGLSKQQFKLKLTKKGELHSIQFH